MTKVLAVNNTVLTILGLVVLLPLVFDKPAHASGSKEQQSSLVRSEQIFIRGLTDQNGAPVTRNRLFGKPAVVHFGFTHCPVVCPTTLHEVGLLMQRLGAKADQLNFVFVSVDPERDTANILKDYIGNFDERILGVTGTTEAVAKLAKYFGTTFSKRPAGEGYNVDHAIFAFLTNTSGKVVSTLYLGTEANRQLIGKRLNDLLSGTN